MSTYTPTNLISNIFSIENITDIKIIKIKEQPPKIITPDFVIYLKIHNQKYLLNIKFQNKESVFYYKINKTINNQNIDFLK